MCATVFVSTDFKWLLMCNIFNENNKNIFLNKREENKSVITSFLSNNDLVFLYY